MYSPEIRPEHISRLHNLAVKRKKPMTKIVNEILTEHFNSKKHQPNKQATTADYEPDYYSDMVRVKCSSCYNEMTVDNPAESAYCPKCQATVFLIPA
ncbi:MAG: hypothetical protein NT007_00235 [Candidatus Kapabacteria bacterium]|nr:hypothetical protein [Candidatus Kapabacteria bacterium]